MLEMVGSCRSATSARTSVNIRIEKGTAVRLKASTSTLKGCLARMQQLAVMAAVKVTDRLVPTGTIT